MKNLIEEFKFKTPKELPPICSLLAGFFSYDIIRYIEKIPNSCKNDLDLPDVRLMRPTSLIIHDNLKKKIFFVVNCYHDEKIKDFNNKYFQIIQEIHHLKDLSKINPLFKFNYKKQRKFKN